MRISVFGLGYVGAVSAACLVRDGHDVIGYDIDTTKSHLLRAGHTPINEPGMEELVAQAVRSGRLEITDDAHKAVHESQVSFICVGTPSLADGAQDLTAIRRVADQLGDAMHAKRNFHLFVVRSTVLPGTLGHVVKPLLEERSGKEAGTDFDLCFQPEFLREGSSIKDYDNPPYTVLGVETERAAAMLREIFGHLPCEFHITSVRTAEMLKYCSNAFHALKITFANEVGRIAHALQIDAHEVMDLVCRDEQLNISAAYLRPGFAFGGPCLPKDLRALLHLAAQQQVETPVLSGITASNGIHIQRAIDIVSGTGRKSVGMIGLSFKRGTDDLRESPLVTLAHHLIGKQLDVRIHDPDVDVARLFGANRRYIEETIPQLSSLLKSSAEEVIRNSEVLVVGLRDERVLRSIYDHCRDDHIVLDLVKVPNRARIRGTYYGSCW